ncbi:MAG: Gfo/Idh/MocA family oxidoreductase [Pirellulales bacterium]|nr:Gfo/Idh/MocA family oxidoreductase [Planctomycetales bacterium]
MARIGIIGVGYWGPNLVRSFEANSECEVVIVCDRSADRLRNISQQFPNVRLTTEADDVLDSDLVDAVVIATPTNTHFELARQALDEGLHVFVEKPLATSSHECQELIALAEAKNLVLFVGHVFLYSAAVLKLKQLVNTGELGDLYYISSRRLNLGPVRHDVNALWDLAPHDISVMLELMDSRPVSVSCSGLAYLHEQLHDVCSLTIQFESRKMGIVHVSWLDPHKTRLMTVVGSKKMAVYNDIDSQERIKVYDQGIDAIPYNDSFGEFQYAYRYGDTYSPRLVEHEPLKAECNSFVDSVITGTTPKTDGYNGLQVVRILEAATVSLLNGNGQVSLGEGDGVHDALEAAAQRAG